MRTEPLTGRQASAYRLLCVKSVELLQDYPNSITMYCAGKTLGVRDQTMRAMQRKMTKWVGCKMAPDGAGFRIYWIKGITSSKAKQPNG